MYHIHKCFQYIFFQLLTCASVLNSFEDKIWLSWWNSGLIFLVQPGVSNICLFWQLVSMEDAVKLSTRMRWLSPLSWCLWLVKHCHAEGGYYWLARFSIFRLSSLRPHKKGFKRQTLCQWQGSDNCSDEVTQRTVNRILQGRDTCSHSKVEHCY